MAKSKSQMPKFNSDEQEQLRQMGIDDPQNLSLGDLGSLLPKLIGFLKTATSLLEKLGPLFERAAEQKADEESEEE